MWAELLENALRFRLPGPTDEHVLLLVDVEPRTCSLQVRNGSPSAQLLWADSPPVLYQLFVPACHAQNGQIFGATTHIPLSPPCLSFRCVSGGGGVEKKNSHMLCRTIISCFYMVNKKEL